MLERRTILRGLTALPFAGSSVVSAATATPDPVFAAIEKHKAAWAAFEAADSKGCGIIHIPAEIEADSFDASQVEEEARFDMHETVPQTIAGLAAYVAYWHEFTKPPEGKEFGQLDEIADTIAPKR
jgi:hypothetical protein